MTTTLANPNAEIRLEDLKNGKRKLTVISKDKSQYVHIPTCTTSYSDQLIGTILRAKSEAYLCDEILRDEDPNYIRRHLELTILSRINPKEFKNKKILDFGCGAGASTMLLARLFPQSTIIGVELEEKNLAVARERADFYRLTNTEFIKSPGGNRLPNDLGKFDVIVLSAVYEHLLPDERKTLMPQLWAMLNTGGYLFLDETPYRWFPIETHTTGLPLLNYLPDSIAHWYAQVFSKRTGQNEPWLVMLRNGIRGGWTLRIRDDLQAGKSACFQRPVYKGIKDEVDLWYKGYAENASGKTGSIKRFAYWILKIFRVITGLAMVPYLSLGIKKT